jgi:hypothetical protein
VDVSVLKKHAASIFCPAHRGGRFLQTKVTVSDYTASLLKELWAHGRPQIRKTLECCLICCANIWYCETAVVF